MDVVQKVAREYAEDVAALTVDAEQLIEGKRDRTKKGGQLSEH